MHSARALASGVMRRIRRTLRPQPPAPRWSTHRWDILNGLIEAGRLASYLEIGVSVGHTFRQVVCAEKIGVDLENPSAIPQVVLSRSDQYFARTTRRFDLVFVDGLHTYEQSLADAVNALRRVSDHGFVVLHDCNPLDAASAGDPQDAGSVWNGQVFNTANHLRQSAGIELRTVNTDYGVAILRRTGPFELLAPYRPLTYRQFARHREEYLNLISVDTFQTWLSRVPLTR